MTAADGSRRPSRRIRASAQHDSEMVIHGTNANPALVGGRLGVRQRSLRLDVAR